MTMKERVILAMERYAVVNLTDGTIGIEDVNNSTMARCGLTADDEPYDICDDMNAESIIAAMREPTEAMYAVNYDNGEGAEIWRTMIDAALTEPGT